MFPSTSLPALHEQRTPSPLLARSRSAAHHLMPVVGYSPRSDPQAGWRTSTIGSLDDWLDDDGSEEQGHSSSTRQKPRRKKNNRRSPPSPSRLVSPLEPGRADRFRARFRLLYETLRPPKFWQQFGLWAKISAVIAFTRMLQRVREARAGGDGGRKLKAKVGRAAIAEGASKRRGSRDPLPSKPLRWWPGDATAGDAGDAEGCVPSTAPSVDQTTQERLQRAWLDRPKTSIHPTLDLSGGFQLTDSDLCWLLDRIPLIGAVLDLDLRRNFICLESNEARRSLLVFLMSASLVAATAATTPKAIPVEPATKTIEPTPPCLLRTLNLEGNLLQAAAVESLCEALLGSAHSPSTSPLPLETLNLGRNAFGDVGAAALGSLLSSGVAPLVRELDLGWDSAVTAEGARRFATAASGNASLVRLDLSGWPFGDPRGTLGVRAVRALGGLLQAGCSRLEHIDLSHTGLEWQSHSDILTTALSRNHRLLGIHLSGTDLATDLHGWPMPRGCCEPSRRHDHQAANRTTRRMSRQLDIQLCDELSRKKAGRDVAQQRRANELYASARRAKAALAEAQDQLRRAVSTGAKGPILMWEQRVRSEEFQARNCAQQAQQANPRDCLGHCWCCDRWTEVMFRYRESLSGPAAQHVYVHLSVDAWVPHRMLRVSEDEFALAQVCPPSRVQYFFSVDCTKLAAAEQKQAAPRLPPTINQKTQICEINLPPEYVNEVVVVRRHRPVALSDLYELEEELLGDRQSSSTRPAAGKQQSAASKLLPRTTVRRSNEKAPVYMTMSNKAREAARKGGTGAAYRKIGSAHLASSCVLLLLGGEEEELEEVKRLFDENYLEFRCLFAAHAERTVAGDGLLLLWQKLVADIAKPCGLFSELRGERMNERELQRALIDVRRFMRMSPEQVQEELAGGEAAEAPSTTSSYRSSGRGGSSRSAAVAPLNETEFIGLMVLVAVRKYELDLAKLCPWQRVSRLIQLCILPYVQGPLERSQSPDYFRENVFRSRRVQAPLQRYDPMLRYLFRRQKGGRTGVLIGDLLDFCRHSGITAPDPAPQQQPESAPALLDDAAITAAFESSNTGTQDAGTGMLNFKMFSEALARIAKAHFSLRSESRSWPLEKKITALLEMIEEENRVPASIKVNMAKALKDRARRASQVVMGTSGAAGCGVTLIGLFGGGHGGSQR